MVIEARERTGWVDCWAKELNPRYQGVAACINRFKDPTLSSDGKANAARSIRIELDRALSDSLPIPQVVHGPMGRSRDLGIPCGRIAIRSNGQERPITGEVFYLKRQGFAIFDNVLSPRPLILEARGEIASGNSLLDMMQAWQIRELARRVFVGVAKMSTAA